MQNNKLSNLCFDSSLFMKKDFSVDEFLTEHRRIAHLETLRDDLGIYLKNLRSSTIELINKDYADFVDLSSNLIMLERSLSSIQAPISNIKNDVNKTKLILNEKIDKIMDLIKKKKLIVKKMRSLKSAIETQNTLQKLNLLLQRYPNRSNDFFNEVIIMKRISNEINQYHYHSKQCDNLDTRITMDFNKYLDLCLTYLKSLFLSLIKERRKEISNCLRLYFDLNKVSEVYDLVKNEIVAPVLSKIINEESLRNEPSGLEGLYSKILLFIDDEMKFLLHVTQQQSKDQTVERFDFMVYSVWPDLEERLEYNLKSIYSPGDPNTFFKCYTITCSFLDKFEERCRTCQSVKNLRNLKSYQNFLHCWNLPVYYTLRFQELGGKLEKIIHSDESFVINTDSDHWKLLVTKEVWFCLNFCWDENIFIRQIAHRFWKFNLQILARYSTWMFNITKMENNATCSINFLIYLYIDGCNLNDRIREIFEIAKERIGPELSNQTVLNMQKCSEESKQLIQNTLKKVEDKLITLILDKNAPMIRQVSDIPRLYRRTNKETPTQPCPYISSLLISIQELKNIYSSHTSKWITPVLSAITSMYYEQLFEVLTSVQRTEESLRKFKKIRDPSSQNSKNNTDDDKIKLQLYIDIQHYINTIKTLTDDRNSINKLQDLNDILNSLKRS